MVWSQRRQIPAIALTVRSPVSSLLDTETVQGETIGATGDGAGSTLDFCCSDTGVATLESLLQAMRVSTAAPINAAKKVCFIQGTFSFRVAWCHPSQVGVGGDEAVAKSSEIKKRRGRIHRSGGERTEGRCGPPTATWRRLAW